jgi:predicted nucleic acid-binding protein
VRGYLVDVNHVRAHFDGNPSFMARLRDTPPDTLLRVCAVTLGEIQAGHVMSTSTNLQRRDDYERFIIETYHYVTLPILVPTCISYAQIVGGIWKQHPPKGGVQTERHLVDLGVDINDVWLVASALEHGLTVLTTDAMTCIKEAVGATVIFDCWI